MLVVLPAECSACRVHCSHHSLSERDLCFQCESQAEERHGERVFRNRAVLTQAVITCRFAIMVQEAIKRLKEARRGVHATCR